MAKIYSNRPRFIHSSKKLSSLGNDKENKFYETQSTGSDSLLKKSLDWFTQVEKPEIDKEEYCNYLLLRFSISDLLIKHNFKRRPIAASICEDYYKEKISFLHQLALTVVLQKDKTI